MMGAAVWNNLNSVSITPSISQAIRPIDSESIYSFVLVDAVAAVRSHHRKPVGGGVLGDGLAKIAVHGARFDLLGPHTILQ